MVLALLLLAACSQAPDTAPQSFTLAGAKVEFAPPPPTWTKRAQEIPAAQELSLPKSRDGKPVWPEARELPGGDLVLYTPPWSEGHLTVSAISGWPDKELTEAHIRHLQNAVLKRQDGQVLAQEEGKLGGATGYEMPFSYVENGKAMKGVQVHVIHGGSYFSVVLLVPADRFGEAEPVFRHVVDTWKFL